LLKEAALTFANCANTPEARSKAQEDEQEILSKINKLDPHFAERCGYKG
jgi:hypothetical protein